SPRLDSIGPLRAFRSSLMSLSVSTSLALATARKGNLKSALSTRIATSWPSSPRSVPRKRRRPSTGTFSSILASWPAQREKSIGRVSGRSIPGEETSISYSPSIGSSASMKSSRAWESAVQPSTSMLPSGRSAITCKVLLAPPMMRRRTSLKPAFSITGSNTGSRCDAAWTLKTKAFRPRRSCDRHTTALVVWDGADIRPEGRFYKTSVPGRRDADIHFAARNRLLKSFLAGLFRFLTLGFFVLGDGGRQNHHQQEGQGAAGSDQHDPDIAVRGAVIGPDVVVIVVRRLFHDAFLSRLAPES